MNNSLNRNSVLVASRDQVSADLSSNTSGSIVILSLKDGMYYELKEVASRVWSLIQQPTSIQAVLDALLEEYEVEAGRCEADLIALAEDLSKRGLVEIK
jgi:hypothetical protein